MITPRSSTETLITALRVMAEQLPTVDGVMNAALDEAADRMEEMQRQLERFGWQPIETVPKDGTVILVTNEKSWVHPAAWNNADEKYPWAFMDGAQELNGMMEKYPTHWMPLPDPDPSL
jgi:hypothetical protein